MVQVSCSSEGQRPIWLEEFEFEFKSMPLNGLSQSLTLAISFSPSIIHQRSHSLSRPLIMFSHDLPTSWKALFFPEFLCQIHL